MKLNGSQVVIEILLEHGVDTVFGYPGGTALNIFDALYEYQDQIKTITTAHEQGASHAADGYQRATGKTGVVLATSGPGATNLVTGLATAYMDSIPMVAITANVPDNLIGRDAFQEVSIANVTMPITKHNYFVNDIKDLPKAMHDAFRIANSGRKGPVLVDITKDVTAANIDYKPGKYLTEPEKPELEITDRELEKIAEVINSAKRPVIYFGGGVVASDAADEVNAFMDKADIPVTHTMMAAGVVGYDHPRNMGLIGMHGTVAANKSMDKADVMIALGTRFSDRVALNPKKWAKRSTKIQIDIDKSELGKNVPVDYSVAGDVKEFLQRLLPLIEEGDHKEWVDEVTEMKKLVAVTDDDPDTLHPYEVVKMVCENTDKETLYVTDVGQHQMWAAQYLEHKNTRRFISSGGLGTMGYGYGAAIGAQIGCPDNRVIHFTGDGSFHMNLNEACTAVTHKLPIITVIMNNQVLGMVYQWQTLFYGKRYSNTVLERKTDFKKLAEAFGATGFRATNKKEFEEAIKAAMKVDGPVWIDCAIDREERVLPMIPGGGTVDDMIVG
jgi:acetolactate synthase-1/2/3 large subunit